MRWRIHERQPWVEDRDMGAPRGAAPPTPPGIRVTYRSPRSREETDQRVTRSGLCLSEQATCRISPFCKVMKVQASRFHARRGKRLERVTGGKTPSEYMSSELPQVADIVRRVRRYSVSPSYCGSPRSGYEQFRAELLPNNATRLSRIDWLWSPKRASVWVTGGSRCRFN